MLKQILPTLALITVTLPVTVRASDSLHLLGKYSYPVYYSKGQETRAITIGRKIENALNYYVSQLGFKPDMKLYVLDTADWKTNALPGAVYGMPHYDEKEKKLVIAAMDNPFWKSFLPAPDQLPEVIRENYIAVYGEGNGISARPFFDLLGIHELGHAFHIQKGIKMQRNWMGELFVNIMLHTYIAEKEPDQLPALTLFPRLVVSAGAKQYTYTSLPEIHQRYMEIATKYPRNYGWYQCKWHVGSATIYDAAGSSIGRKLWNALNTNNNALTDEELISMLEKEVHQSIADFIRNWDHEL